MSSKLRRMVNLGPAHCIYPGSAQDYRTGSNRTFFSDTRTRWVRMWADWPSLEPARGQWDATKLASLDAQIARARRDGLRVVLTLYRFPTWANGTGALTSAQLDATMPDRKFSADPVTKAKSLLLRYPDDLSATGDFARFVERLVRRYGRNGPDRPSRDTWVDFLELCNEPNHMWWPQQAPSTTGDPYSHGTITVHDAVVRMFVTGRQITSRYGDEPMLAGPGSADGDESNRLRTGYHSLAERILNALAAAGFVPGAGFAWTHHNYTDVTYDQGPGSTSPDAATTPTRSTNRAGDMRRRLIGRWAGWPNADAANPEVLLTEGGVTLANVRARWGITDPDAQRRKQAELVQRNWNRMANDGEGAGIAMLAAYLFYTDPNYDSGLCEAHDAGGAKRHAYTSWRTLPSYS